MSTCCPWRCAQHLLVFVLFFHLCDIPTRQYCYPHFKDEEIEAQENYMLVQPRPWLLGPGPDLNPVSLAPDLRPVINVSPFLIIK